jgi:hypothetical protein
MWLEPISFYSWDVGRGTGMVYLQYRPAQPEQRPERIHSKVRVRWSGDETETFTTTYHVMDSSCRSQIEKWSDTLTGAYDTADRRCTTYENADR